MRVRVRVRVRTLALALAVALALALAVALALALALTPCASARLAKRGAREGWRHTPRGWPGASRSAERRSTKAVASGQCAASGSATRLPG